MLTTQLQALCAQFWHFSVDFYQQQAHEQALLQLQDQAGLNVNLLIFAIWLAKQQQSLTTTQWHHLNADTQMWQTKIIQPLRQARRASKQLMIELNLEHADFRTQLKQNELEAEKMEQQLIIRHYLRLNLTASSEQSSRSLIRHNLHRYFESQTQELSATVEALFSQLI